MGCGQEIPFEVASEAYTAEPLARNLALTAQRPSSKAQSSSRISTTSWRHRFNGLHQSEALVA